MKFLRSLKVRIASGVTLVVALALIAQMGVTTFRVAKQARAQGIAQAKTQTELAAPIIVETYLEHKDALGLELTKSMRTVATKLQTLEYFQIIDMKGAVAFDSRSLKRAVKKETVSEKSELTAIQSSRTSEQVTPAGHLFIQPYFDASGAHTYTVRSAVSFDATSAVNRSSLIQLLIMLAIILPSVFLFVTWILKERIFKPIDKIRAASNAIAGGDYDERISMRSHDEFSFLAQNLNHMVETMGESIKGLEEEKAWKNEFLVLASHNLRTPLTVIMSSVSALRKEGKVPKASEKYLDYIASRGKELHALIENMLSISMLKGGKIKKNDQPFDLVPLAEQIVKDQEPRIQDKKVVIKLATEAKHAIVTGDENLIFQVLDNLLDNAIKFTPEGGTITLSLVDSPQVVNVSVKDSGAGIPQDMINKLFQSFHRGSNPMSVDHKGAGLGLYFVKLAVESHDGEISIKSKEGHGTEILFTLPKKTV